MIFVSALLLFVLLITPTAALLGFGECEYTREDCIKCAIDKCDFDRDGRLSSAEVSYIFENVLDGAARWAALEFTSPDLAIEHCGDVETGYVTRGTFEKSSKCIQYCFEKRMFQKLVCSVLDDAVLLQKHRDAFLLQNPLEQDDPRGEEYK